MQQNLPIIRTKTLVPRRRKEILSRSRLLSILDNVFDLKLLILAAPAGYGKTSLLVDYAHQTKAPVCWLALDPLDSDPKRFITHFIVSLQQKFPSFGQIALSTLQDLREDTVNLDPVISAIVNDAYDVINEHFLFVLDDYHLVRDSKPIETFINRIIQETAENFHFIIASRALLTLPDLSLLVAHSQVDGLSFEELAFIPSEIQQLMANNYQKTISEEVADEMISNTEGWITGLLLTAQLSEKDAVSQSRVKKVSGVDIYDYLTQQVFSRQPPKMQQFLLRTSVLEEFDANLCEEVIAKALNITDQNWQEVIEAIQRDNLFVLPVGDETLYLRYHQLFRDFLQTRMKADYPEETLLIEKQLAAYYEFNREWERAIAIYSRVGTVEQQVQLVCKAASSMIVSGRLVTLSSWLDLLPPNLVDSKPELLSIRGSIAMLRGDFAPSLDLLNKSIKLMDGTDLVEELGYALIRRSALNRHLGHYEDARRDALTAIELTRGPTGNKQQLAEALRSEGLVYFQIGELSNGLEKLDKAYQQFIDMNYESDAAKVLVDIGCVYDAMGDIDHAELCFSRSLEYWQKANSTLWQANLHNNIGVIQYQKGKYVESIISFEKALTYSRVSANPRLESYTLTSMGDLFRHLLAFKEARQAYSLAATILEETNDLSLDIYVTLAQAALERSSSNYHDASKLIEKALTVASGSGSKFEYNSCLLEQSLLEFKAGHLDKLPETLLKLESDFLASGHHVEAFKTAMLSLILSSSVTQLNNIEEKLQQLSSSTKNSNYLAMLQIGLEFKDKLQSKASDAKYKEVLSRLLNEISEFEKKLPKTHRIIRRHSSSIEFAHPSLTIRGLGRVQVLSGGKILSNKDWKTQGVRDLFFYLLSQSKGVTKEEIGEEFWPDIDRDTLRLRFKNTIYRLRRAVGPDTISFTDDEYFFNRSIDYEYDVETYQDELESAKKTQTKDEQIAHLHAAVAAYHGNLLPKLDYDWVIIERERLRLTFIDAALELTNLYLENQDFQLAINTANRALQEDIFDESAYRAAMVAHAALNDRPAVVRLYEKCKSTLKIELDLEPSAETTRLFNTLIER